MKFFRNVFLAVVPALLMIFVLFLAISLQGNAPAADGPANTNTALAATASIPSLAVSGENIILVELCNQGLLEPEILRTDEKFGALVDTEYPLVLEGYRAWAPAVVNWMRRSRQVALWVNEIAKPWTAEMAFIMGESEKGSLLGKIEMYFGFIVSWFIAVTMAYFYIQIAWLLLFSLWMYLSLRRLMKSLWIPVWNLSRKNG